MTGLEGVDPGDGVERSAVQCLGTDGARGGGRWRVWRAGGCWRAYGHPCTPRSSAPRIFWSYLYWTLSMLSPWQEAWRWQEAAGKHKSVPAHHCTALRCTALHCMHCTTADQHRDAQFRGLRLEGGVLPPLGEVPILEQVLEAGQRVSHLLLLPGHGGP